MSGKDSGTYSEWIATSSEILAVGRSHPIVNLELPRVLLPDPVTQAALAKAANGGATISQIVSHKLYDSTQSIARYQEGAVTNE